MVERDYYKLPSITRYDVAFLKRYVERTESDELRKLHRSFVDTLVHIANATEIIQRSARASIDEKRSAQSFFIEIEENLQGQIEQNALPILKELRQKRADIINTSENAISFFHFVAHQYFRTKGIREDIGKELSQTGLGKDFSHLKHIVCHIAAVNVGATLYRDRNDFNIVFLEARHDVGFITGDQPVVNICGTEDGSETSELAFYYPLSPILSCLIAPKKYGLCSTDVSNELIEELNDFIAWASNDFLVAKSKKLLQHIINKSLLTRRPTSHILDALARRHILS